MNHLPLTYTEMKHTDVRKQTLGLKVVAAVINIGQIHRHEKWATCPFC